MTRRATNPIHLPRDGLTPAEKLTRTDDLMSDVLDACLWPSDPFPVPNDKHHIQKKRTIKFTPEYRRPRSLNVDDVKIVISRLQSGQIRNISEATLLIRQIPAVTSYIGKGEPPRVGKHIGLYLQLFQPKCGVKFCETNRYDQRRQAPEASPLPSTRASSSALPDSLPSGAPTGPSSEKSSTTHSTPEPRSSTPSTYLDRPARKSRRSIAVENTSPNHRIHLAVFAARDYVVNDIVVGCEGSFADLTEEEDIRLRGLNPPLEGHPDFSHLVNSRGKFQVFCGPARFVNHDCQNNVVLLREGFTIKFKVVAPIRANQEILTSYGANYFGESNCECMCASCERAGRGFYSEDPISSQVPLPLDLPPTTDNTREGSELTFIDVGAPAAFDCSPSSSSMKEEWNKLLSTHPTPPSLQLDKVNLSLQSIAPPEGDEIASLTERTKANRRQSAAAALPRRGRPPPKRLTLTGSTEAVPFSTPQPSKASPNPSRSSSLRRHPSRARVSNANPTASVRRGFKSQVRFTNTTDLTLPVYSPSGLPNRKKTVFEDSWPVEQDVASGSSSLTIKSEVTDDLVDGPTARREVTLPAKRKTYWITSKQRQLGLLPWESSQPSHFNPAPPLSEAISSNASGSAGSGRYSSITPSLLGPTGHERRRMVSTKLPSVELASQTPKLGKRKRETGDEHETVTNTEQRLPKRSYWISTRQKRLGIVPWEPPPSSSLPDVPSPPVRATRSALKAIEGVKPFKGLPSAPRGSRLNFRVIESGTFEAGLLGSAIGRELLGFRPVKTRNGKPEASGSGSGSLDCVIDDGVELNVPMSMQNGPKGSASVGDGAGEVWAAKTRRKMRRSAPLGRIGRKSKVVGGSGSRSNQGHALASTADGVGPFVGEREDVDMDAVLSSIVAVGDWSSVARVASDRVIEKEDSDDSIRRSPCGSHGLSQPMDYQDKSVIRARGDSYGLLFAPEKEDSEDSLLTSPPRPGSRNSLPAQPVNGVARQDEGVNNGEKVGGGEEQANGTQYLNHEELVSQKQKGDRVVMMMVIDGDEEINILGSADDCEGLVKRLDTHSQSEGEVGTEKQVNRRETLMGNGLAIHRHHDHHQQQQQQSASEGSVLSELEDLDVEKI